MCSVLVTLIFGYMMMVVMKRKVRIISGETFGRRYLLENFLIEFTRDTIRSSVLHETFWICSLLDRHQRGLSVHSSLCLCPMVNLMDRGMRLAIILLFQIILSRKKYRGFFYLGFKALEQAQSSSRYGLSVCCFDLAVVFSTTGGLSCDCCYLSAFIFVD